MIKICGTWEFGYDTPIKEHDLWAYGLQDFGIDEWIMWPKSGIKSNRVIEYNSLDEVLEYNKDMTPVFVVENGKKESMDFIHPENPIYILGKASFNPWAGDYSKELSVRIDTPYNIGGLWGHQAILMLLRDKQWQLH